MPLLVLYEDKPLGNVLLSATRIDEGEQMGKWAIQEKGKKIIIEDCDTLLRRLQALTFINSKPPASKPT